MGAHPTAPLARTPARRFSRQCSGPGTPPRARADSEPFALTDDALQAGDHCPKGHAGVPAVTPRAGPASRPLEATGEWDGVARPGSYQLTAQLALRATPVWLKAGPSSCLAPRGAEDSRMPDDPLLTRKDGMGRRPGSADPPRAQDGPGIDRTDAGPARPWGRRGATRPSMVGVSELRCRKAHPPAPGMLCSAHPVGQGPCHGAGGRAEAWPAQGAQVPLAAVGQPQPLAWQGPQEPLALCSCWAGAPSPQARWEWGMLLSPRKAWEGTDNRKRRCSQRRP